MVWVRLVDPGEDQVAHPNEDLVREAFAAFGRGDLDALRQQYFAEGLRYQVPGRSPVAGDYEDAAQVVEFFGRLFELFTVRAERGAKKLADNTVLESHVRDGKMTEAWIYQTDQYAVDEFWS